MELKPCPRSTRGNGMCHVEFVVIRTMAKPPKNIRVGCTTHEFWLPDTFSSMQEAAQAWNRMPLVEPLKEEN